LLCGLLKTDGEVKLGFNGDLYPTAGATSVMTTKGDMIDYDTIRQRLAIGSANQILQVKSSLPSWETVDLADTVLTTAGDVLYENATPELARLGAGTQYYNLQMGSALPAWAASSSSVLTAAQDVLYSSAANTLARLAAGSDGDVLTTHSTGSAPTWETPSGGGVAAAWITGDYGGDADSGNANVFAPFGYGRESGFSTTESNESNEINTNVTCTRHVDRAKYNDKNEDTDSAFRDDGADVGALSITASTTGLFDSGAISVSIAAGSLCNWHFDTSSSNNGALNLKNVVEFS